MNTSHCPSCAATILTGHDHNGQPIHLDPMPHPLGIYTLARGLVSTIPGRDILAAGNRHRALRAHHCATPDQAALFDTPTGTTRA